MLHKALTGAFVHDGTFSTFRDRPWGRPVPPGTDGHRFVVCAQNHDQVGNRALGDRPSARLDTGGLAIEAAFVLLSPFTPMLFMGEEWGARTPWQFFTDYTDPVVADAVRDGRREEFSGHGWKDLYGGDVEVPDPQSPQTFARSVLDRTQAQTPDGTALRDWYRTLARLRRQVADLGSGDLAATDLTWSDDVTDGAFDGWLVLHRGAARVVVNLSDRARAVPVHVDGPLACVATWGGVATRDGDDPRTAELHLAPRAVAVLVATSADDPDAVPRAAARTPAPRGGDRSRRQDTSAAPSAASDPSRDSAR